MAELMQILDPISTGSAKEESGYQICRFCLANSANYINLLEKCGEEISTFLQTYHNISIDPCDSWPKSACLSCVSRITSFRTLCDTIRKSEEVLRQIFGDSSNVCIKKEQEDEEACEEVFSESLPECFPGALPESFSESVMETKIEVEREELPVEEKLDEIEEFFSMTCELCKKAFRKFEELRHHFRDEHKRRWFIRCCKRKLRFRKSILIHLQYHRNPDIFKCSECSRQFKTEEERCRHIENCHKPDNKVFECHLCQKAYATRGSLRLHIILIHLKAPKPKKKSNSSAGSVIKCICEICGKSLINKERLRKHVKIHALGPNGEPLRDFKCEICGNEYKTSEALRIHAKKHDPYGTYKCKECGKISPTPTALKRHILEAHRLTRAYVCRFCNKGFKRNIALKVGVLPY